MKLFFTCSLIILSLFSFSQVRISQVYGAGGNPGATYNRDFIELFNAGTTNVDISNWSVQYASATGPVAPGNWAVTGIPAGNSIDPGKYFLIALASGGAVGIALPATDFLNNGINISNTAGKIALVTNTTALNGTTACSDPSVIDVIGYGAAASCFEGSTASTTGIDNTMSILRAADGCTDTNDNSSDFSIGLINPRNSLSPANSCGPATALLTALPTSLNIFSTVGIASVSQSYILNGLNLSGFPANITLTASAGLQVSLSSGSGFAGSINVPYTSATLPNTTIYVRIAATAPQGVMNGTVTNSGGGATNAIVTMSGGVYQDYYNTKADNGLNVLSTWSSTPDGLGFTPVDFMGPFQAFNIVNQTNAHYTGVWDVSDPIFSPRVIVGDGTNPINLTIPAGPDSITMATRVNVLNNGTLTIQNNRRPFLNNLATGSTVDFAQAGITASDTIRIPNISFYNLKLTGGLKYFSPLVTTIRGDLTADGVVSMNGSAPVFSTINAFGNVSFINGSVFEPLPTGDAARITLAMNGSGTQAITGNQIHLFRLQRDSTNSNSVITLTGELFLGNAGGGGLRLNQAATTTTVLDLRFFPAGGRINLVGSGVITTSANGKINADGQSIVIAKSGGNTNAGTLRFVNGALIHLLVNFDPAFTKDSIMIADSVDVEYLTLTKGRVVVNPAAVLTIKDGPLLAGGHITGGSSTAFVDGKLRQSGLIGSSADPIFPVGKGDKFAPVALYNVISADITIEYFFNDFGNHTINPALLATSAFYNVSYHEYWILNHNGLIIPNSPELSFYYTDARSGILNPPFVKMAHFNGTDWDDFGGVADGSNTLTNGFVTVQAFEDGPVTFSAAGPGVLPVRLTSFTAQKENKTVKLNWSTSQEINSSHFIVQRSADGTHWTDIARVNAAGNSNTISNYNLVDYTPAKAINYYRLKQYDINSRFDYSITRTAFFSADFEVAVTPNPAKDFINIYISKNSNSIATISLTDMNGKTLQHFTNANSFIQISTSGMAKGMYILKVIDGDNVSVKKVMLQ
ncbi:MAG: T9SS type A sorting domain-containing protein [Ferruginibacter sp.]